MFDEILIPPHQPPTPSNLITKVSFIGVEAGPRKVWPSEGVCDAQPGIGAFAFCEDDGKRLFL